MKKRAGGEVSFLRFRRLIKCNTSYMTHVVICEVEALYLEYNATVTSRLFLVEGLVH